jgi:hypothetical protein
MERGLDNDISDIFSTVSSSLSVFGASVIGSFENLFEPKPETPAAVIDDNLDEWTLLDHSNVLFFVFQTHFPAKPNQVEFERVLKQRRGTNILRPARRFT